jgi:hypothetical protein
VNLFELLIFFSICIGFGFLGRLISHSYGWLVGVLAAPVLIFFMIEGFGGAPSKGRRTGQARPLFAPKPVKPVLKSRAQI